MLVTGQFSRCRAEFERQQAFANFTIPEKDEGFDEIKFIWQDEAQSSSEAPNHAYGTLAGVTECTHTHRVARFSVAERFVR